MLKSILYIALLFVSFAAFAQEGCFHAIQDGQEVEVICTNKPVFFRNCTPPGPNTTIFYYPGPEKYTSQTNLLTGEQATTYSNPGSYTVTQFINDEDGDATQIFEKTFEVKSANTAPAFSVTACAANAVSVTVTDGTYDTYSIDFGDGNSRVTQADTEVKYTYAGSGTYTITVTGKYTGSSCASSSTSQVTTLPPAPAPTLQNITVIQQGNSGEVRFDLQNLHPGYLYIVERWQDPRTNFQKIDTIRNVTQNSISHTLRGVNTAEGVWYLVRIADQCNSTISGSNSNIVSSIALDARSGNEQALLSWQSMPGAAQYEVYRNNTRITTLNSNTTSYTDAGLSCGQTYTYYVKGIGPDGSASTSAPQAVQVTSTLPPVAPYILASFNLNNEVELSINLPQDKVAQKIDIQRSINGAAFQNLASVQQSPYSDALTKLEHVCYRATFTDPCNNTSGVSNTACPMLLKAEQQADGAVQLSWSAYSGFQGGVRQYTVELLDGAGNIVTSYNAAGTIYTDRALSDDQQVLRYRIRATSNTGTEVSYSNLEEIEQDLQVYVPSAFTPNGDGLNDVLEIKGRFIQGYTLKVYNSLGNVVFETTDRSSNWDGTYQGKLLPAGAYAYEITVKTKFGSTKRRTGTVTLLR